MKRVSFLVSLFSVFSTINSFSQNLDSLLNLSAFTAESDLQKELNKATTVASGKALTARETPGILSVITQEEIKKSGARDMIDILRTVPGFDVAQDLQFITGVTFRGNWANEGKVLFLIDGQQINDLLYQTVPVLNNFPIDAIERIEIIRGPGSAIYGGSAEYAVVNITTRQASSLNGVNVYTTLGLHSSAVGRLNGGVMLGQKKDTYSWDLGLFKGKGISSDQKNFIDAIQSYLQNDPTTYNLSKVSQADPMNVNLGFRAAGFQFRGMFNGYKSSDPATFVTYDNYSADFKYDWKLNDKLTVTPQYVYMNQVPWAYGDATNETYSLRARAIRNSGSVLVNYNASRKVNVAGGALYFHDQATDLLQGQYFGVDKFKLNNHAVFLQMLVKHRLANFTAGARYEKNNVAGDAFVPRIALTKKIENLHFKVLYSQAFRTPSIENIHLAENGKVVPEKSTVFEVELGYQFTPEMLLSLNAFNIKTKNVINYLFISDAEQYYKNHSLTGSSGVEAVYSIKKKRWDASANYTHAVANSGSTVDNYMLPQTTAQYAGIAKSKFAMSANFIITDNLSLNTSLISSGKRYAYTTVDNAGASQATELKSYTLVNSFVNYSNLVKGLTIGLGAYDIFNQKPSIPQAYNGNYAPVPGRSREWVIKINYQLNFNK